MIEHLDEPPREQFSPERRGWAALRLVAFVPPALRDEICAAAQRPLSRGSLAGTALAVVSTPAAIAWSREIAQRVPVLGVAAGPACLARLWVARLLRPGGAIGTCWPDAVDIVWQVVRPILEKLGVEARGPRRAELRHEVAAPLALALLASLAAGRRDLRLVGVGAADRPDGPPFGWAPGIDSLGAAVRFLIAGQVPGRFQSHALLSSPLARLVRETGLAALVSLPRWRCGVCGVRADADAGRCPQCGGRLAMERVRRLVARQVLEQPAAYGSAERHRPGGVAGRAEAACLAVHDRVEAAAAQRACVGRARALWEKVVGERSNVTTMVILGALAGVSPLEVMADRPRPRGVWLERLVETLTEGRLDRETLVRDVAAALPLVAARLGRPVPPEILAPYVGVLATRLRQAILCPAEA
jgi:Zn-finger nucleic acid-binding protein